LPPGYSMRIFMTSKLTTEEPPVGDTQAQSMVVVEDSPPEASPFALADAALAEDSDSDAADYRAYLNFGEDASDGEDANVMPTFTVPSARGWLSSRLAG
jgi:hypothetical protein